MPVNMPQQMLFKFYSQAYYIKSTLVLLVLDQRVIEEFGFNNICSRFSWNSEASASEFIENLEEMLLNVNGSSTWISSH